MVFYVTEDCAGLGTGYLALIKSDMHLGQASLLWKQQTTIVSHWTPWIDPRRRTLVSYGRLWSSSSIRAEFLFLVLSCSITLFLALFFLGEVVAHEDTKSHRDSNTFDLFCLFYFDGRTNICCLNY